MLALIFWLCVALDAAVVLLVFVLGLAAAKPSGTAPAQVALVLLALPAGVLAAAAVTWVRSRSPLWRGLAFVVAVAPPVVAVATQASWRVQLRAYGDAAGELTFFTAGPSRDLVEAIRRNDAAAVAALVPQVDVNAAGLAGMTPLVAALRQLRATPERQEALPILLAAGADTNLGAGYELPLEMALQIVRQTGPAPVRMLLDAGADPNRTGPMGTPLWFAGAGHSVGIDVLSMLLAHGADLNATGPRGERILFYAADARNWDAVTFLLDRGVDPQQGRSPSGQTFAAMLDADAGWASADPGFAEVRERLGLRR
ncbi:MAG: hypothetical protein KIT14_09445 [bacterium]|nr:hypothetical protein [bacterium]